MSSLNLTLTLEEHPFVLSVENEEGLFTTIDASQAIGGKQKGLRPMELLAGALAGCMSIDVLSILRKQRLEIQSYEVKVVAKRSDGVPAKFESIELQFLVDEHVPLDKVEHAVNLSREKYCSVSASIDPQIHLTTIVKHKQ